MVTALGILMTAAVALTACGDNDNQSSQGNNVQQETAEIQSLVNNDNSERYNYIVEDTVEVQQDTVEDFAAWVWDCSQLDELPFTVEHAAELCEGKSEHQSLQQVVLQHRRQR